MARLRGPKTEVGGKKVTESAEGTQQVTSEPAAVADPPAIQQRPSAAGPQYVYAIGRIEPRFPSLAVEKEFAQAAGRTGQYAGRTDNETIQFVLTQQENKYLLSQMCFVLTVQGLEAYILYPRDPADFALFADAIRPAPRPTDIDVVIGVRGLVAPPETCNGLMVPIVIVDQLYTFDLDTLVEMVPVPDDFDDPERFRSTTEEIFLRVLQTADNAGASDEHRALNYLAVRYPLIYERAARSFLAEASLTAVDARPSRFGGVHSVVDVIFSFTDRRTDVVDKHFVRVDVSGEFPFLVTKLSPYVDH
jgi:hypothetical protein